MPVAIVVHFKTTRPLSPIQLRGWLYHSLTPHFPGLHRGQGPRPFSLATGSDSSQISWARLAFLRDELASVMLEHLWSQLGRTLPIGKKGAPLLAIYERDHPLTGRKTWRELLNATPSADVTLDFQTPTLFKKGDLHYPVPVPERILESLIRHWNAFAPEPVTKSMKDALLQKATFRFLKTYTTTTQAHTLTPGFVGRATLHLPKATEEEARWLSRLGELAFFSGVGAKTTIGFGLTRKVAEDEKETRPHPDGRKN